MRSHSILSQASRIDHLVSIAALTDPQLMSILELAQAFLDDGCLTEQRLQFLAGKTFVNAFFEYSTRTRISFELAAKRLQATVINFDVRNASTAKGETLLDTIDTFAAMGCHGVIMRTAEPGIAGAIAEHSALAVVNAGDGAHAHPSQALLDALTIHQVKPEFSGLKIALVGDILHSRVARSDITLLQRLGVRDIRLVGPSAFLPRDIAGTECYEDFDQAIDRADVIMMLRIQKERMPAQHIPDAAEYHQHYGLTKARLRLAADDAIVLHPGPINRDIEISSEVIDCTQSKIAAQVTNGVAVRMAVLSLLKL